MTTTNKRNRMMNRSRILRAIWYHPNTSRVDAAARLGLDKSTVSSIVSELIDGGLIREAAEGDASPQGGRRPVYLELNAEYGYVLGIELQPEFFRAVLVDLSGTALREWADERPRDDRSFEDYLITLLEEVLDAVRPWRDRLLGIGIAVGGLIDSMRNVINRSIPMKIDAAYDVQTRIADRFDLPISVENDANACAWGELIANRGHPVHDFLYVLVQLGHAVHREHCYGGIGVGIGVAINGTLYPGSRFTAGEFRSVFWNQRSTGQFSLSAEEAARVTVDRAPRRRLFRELAQNLALLVNVFGLDHLFIGGDVMRYQDELTPLIHAEIRNNWPYETEVDCAIRYSSYGHRAVVVGAAAMMLDRLFSDRIFPLGDIRNRHERDRRYEQLMAHGFGLEAVQL